jgi:thiol:disulfide interchange protein
MRFFKNRFLLVLLFASISAFAFAQDSSFIKWGATVEKISNGSYKINYVGIIKKGWFVYASDNKSIELDGIKTTHDSSLIKPSALNFVSTIEAIQDAIFKTTLQIVKDSIVYTETITVAGKVPSIVEVELNYSVSNGVDLETEKASLKIQTGEISSATAATNRILIPTININKPLTECKTTSSPDKDDVGSKGLLSIFGLGFLGGLVALIMPCLFPMIPLTVSFFTKKATSRKAGIQNAFLYGFFIFLVYVLITIPFHIFSKLSPDIFNNISTNVYLNIIFFIVFVVFALSFFGLFEITLPSSVTTKADSKSGAKNVTGIFFMALTLTIVSFSCTGPLAGSLLAGAVSGPDGAMRLSFGMGGFGLAIGLPFAIFAMFPNLLNALPKSGGWLNVVKVVFGFLELGFAFKFLSNADLVMHWGLLKREIFIGIWILISAALALYLYNVIKFKHDTPIKKLSVTRIVLASIVSLFTIYLVPGITNTKYANLSFISGFPPPLWYSIYAEKGKEDCVLNLNCTHDYEEGLKMAKDQNKLMLLDFTGFACVNCRKMEENVWSRPEEYKMLKENFIIVSLYVDDKKLLPAENRFTYKTKDGTEREIRTIADKWSVFETENFAQNSQPLYAIVNTKEQLVSYPSGYTDAKGDFLQWLQCGVDYKP